jgi:peptidoglycan/xylan/chitin deacetylase (PgdA/CDA1 family)
MCRSFFGTEDSVKAANMVYLMYHELDLPGRALCDAEAGYVRYVVSEANFRSQIGWLRDSGWTGMSVSQALQSPSERAVAFTFDDGAETDLMVAAPLLKGAGFQATFYITVGFLGRRGYLSQAQVRELHGLRFEIGCHSLTHPYLSDLDPAGLRREIADAKSELEQIVGAAVNHFACPGGRYDERAREVAREAGYASVATSRPQANSPRVDRLALGRVVVMRDTAMGDFQQLCRGEGLWRKQLGVAAFKSAKSLLGNKRYDQIRAMLLGRH